MVGSIGDESVAADVDVAPVMRIALALQPPTVVSGGGPAKETLGGGADNVQYPGTGNDFPRASGITIGDAKLAALADNKGPTLTMAPGADSAALGKGVNCPAADQRGRPRPNTGCTSGAYQADE